MRRRSAARRRLDTWLVFTGAGVAAAAGSGVKLFDGGVQILMLCLLAAGAALGAYSMSSFRPGRSGPPPHILISHPYGDDLWARWLAWRLRRIGYLTSTRPWQASERPLPPTADVPPDHELVIVSRTLLESGHAPAAPPPAGRTRNTLALVTAHRETDTATWAGCEVLSLAGRTADDASDAVEARLHHSGAVPSPEYTASQMTGSAEPRYPGENPRVSNLGPRSSSHFSARRGELVLLRSVLGKANISGDDRTCVIHGLSGVGKTQLALEYAWRFGDLFDVVWLVDAGRPPTTRASLLTLAHELQRDRDPQAANGRQDDSDPQQTLRRLLTHDLPRTAKWLLVYDGAESDSALRDLLPDVRNNGQVLITSVNPAWQRAAPNRIALDVFTAEEATDFLRDETGIDDGPGLARIAERLGRLPLLLRPAAAYLRHSRDIDGYLQLLDAPGNQAWIVSFNQVEADDAVAGLLLRLCAFLAPQGIPGYFFDFAGDRTDLLPRPLAGAAADQVRHRRVMDTARRYSLLTGERFLAMHARVQDTIRGTMTAEDRAAHATDAARLVNGWFPEDPGRESTWPQCFELLLHAGAVLDHCRDHAVVDDNTAALLQSVGEYFRVQDDHDEAQRLLTQALRQREQLRGPSHPLVADTLVCLSRLSVQRAELSEARLYAERALSIRTSWLSEGNSLTLDSHSQLGRVLRELGDFPGASEAAEQTLRRLRRQLGADPVRVAESLCDLGLVRWRQGRLDEAVRHHEEALRLLEDARGGDQPVGRNRSGFVHQALGLALLDSGDLDAAEGHLRSALRVLETAGYPEGHRVVLSSLVHLGETFRQRAAKHLGAPDRRSAWDRSTPGDREAERLLTEAKRIFDKVLSAPHMTTDHPDRACTLVRYAHLLHDQGDDEAAIRQADDAHRIYTDTYGSLHPYVAEACSRRALIREALGQRAGATEDLEAALDIYLRVHPADHPLVRQLDEELGRGPAA
ncbi:FxSxx-COOH system tetratricopeptide repeat protein [Streptomyces sp. NPDC051219]|uniref:FxSxx-COOH system tetratricopeptide repeat protein n=1 Tax=Streptomyces sp. NPDC051219 TaxID=3155283 RepID=UPI003423A269